MRMEVFSLTRGQTSPRAPETHGFLAVGAGVPVTAIQLRPDMAICFWECDTRETESFSVNFDCPVLRFSFILEGSGLSRAKGQEDFPRRKGLIELRYFPKNPGTIILEAGQRHKWLDIVLQPSFLEVALPEAIGQFPRTVRLALERKKAAIPGDSRIMMPEQFVAATHLTHCPYTHAARTLYLKSKVLELLSHVLAEQNPPTSPLRLSSYEEDCLHRARDLLVTNLENPPSLKELARAVGLNQTKLKRGFKAVYGQTVFGYFRAYRVELARQLLLEGGATVSEVASTVGYTNISHFSAAFKERHGITPSRYRKDNLLCSTNR